MFRSFEAGVSPLAAYQRLLGFVFFGFVRWTFELSQQYFFLLLTYLGLSHSARSTHDLVLDRSAVFLFDLLCTSPYECVGRYLFTLPRYHYDLALLVPLCPPYPGLLMT